MFSGEGGLWTETQHAGEVGEGPVEKVREDTPPWTRLHGAQLIRASKSLAAWESTAATAPVFEVAVNGTSLAYCLVSNMQPMNATLSRIRSYKKYKLHTVCPQPSIPDLCQKCLPNSVCCLPAARSSQEICLCSESFGFCYPLTCTAMGSCLNIYSVPA